MPSHAAELKVIRPHAFHPHAVDTAKIIAGRLGIDTRTRQGFARTLPFTGNDTTAGVENEIQASVVGEASQVDLPLSITASEVFENICHMARAGDTSPQLKEDLDTYLNHNSDHIWENSWVQFPEDRLSEFSRKVFHEDLRCDKARTDSPLRKDADGFRCHRNGQTFIRIPISYLMKLALAEAVSESQTDPMIRSEARRMMTHFINDNTSPETHSFYTPTLQPGPCMGAAIAEETAQRLLFSQLLVMYANRKFRLLTHGQRAMIYMAPHPPQRQKRLNELIPDAFYRELFMSPCLSGWDRGEMKQAYMAHCHKVLSRSQLNAVKKLRDAGIITRNLVVLPNLSNTSLANNGTHLSIGSRMLSQQLKDRSSGFGAREEKWIGDLSIKIWEHFLPLFVGTYSGAPYRLDFSDMHPEKALGFLPHELNATHLRMIWRRWKKKAHMKVFGKPITPFGPTWLDRTLARGLNLRGDFVTDFRLVDYLACLMSTRTSGALNGTLGSGAKLKTDLTSMGTFHTEMPLYLLYRLRRYADLGFSGFEGRHYSQFESIQDDLGHAASLQALLSALAFHYIFCEGIRHTDIPDTPKIESERRQFFFGAAIGIPTVYIHRQSRNRFLQRLLKDVRGTRFSHRYPGYVRIKIDEYQKSLVRTIRRDAPELIEHLQAGACLDDLEFRLDSPREGAAGRLTRGILNSASVKSPMQLSADDFNQAAEKYYRDTLRRKQMEEGLDLMEKSLAAIDTPNTWRQGRYNRPLYQILRGRNAREFLARQRQALLSEMASDETLAKLIQLFVLTTLKARHDGGLSDSSRVKQINC
jgi:hypothetical protein